jgi:tetratricopeptide (TPR) repeat protein
MKALVLAHMGRYPEAEAAAKHSLQFAKDSLNLVDGIDRGWLLEVLSCALMGLERWEEAEIGFEGAVELSKRDSDRRTSLAEVYLRQEIEPEKALLWAAEAVDNRYPSFVASLGMRYANVELFANYAWALALAGYHDKAQVELGQALARIDRELPLVQASLCYRAGHVHRLSDDDIAANDYFEQADAIDPNGAFGALARAALDALGPGE